MTVEAVVVGCNVGVACLAWVASLPPHRTLAAAFRSVVGMTRTNFLSSPTQSNRLGAAGVAGKWTGAAHMSLVVLT